MMYFADRRDHAYPLFLDANVLPISLPLLDNQEEVIRNLRICLTYNVRHQ